MPWIAFLVALLLTLFGLVCVLLVAVQLPGTWILLGAALVVELFDPLWLPAGTHTFGAPVLLGCLGVAILGEIVEFLGGFVGAKRAGATRRGILGALVGGVVGALAFTLLLPLPLVGAFVGAVVGSFAGALLGETSGLEPRTWRQSLGPALGAAWGRVWGTVGKLATAVTVWLWLAVAAFWL